jgi:hypothetical protein
MDMKENCRPIDPTIRILRASVALSSPLIMMIAALFLIQWSSYDRIWFPGPYKQEILILILILIYTVLSTVTALYNYNIKKKQQQQQNCVQCGHPGDQNLVGV